MRRSALTAGMLCMAVVLAFNLLNGAAWAQEQPPVAPPGGETGEEAAATGQVYCYLDGQLAPVPRDIAAGGQTLEFAVMELLNGPSEEERQAGYVTYIPEGVKLQFTTIKQDRSEYTINLSRELLALSGDRSSAVKALAQLVKTVREAGGIPKVGVTVASEELSGMPEDAFAALGVSAEEVEREVSGEEPPSSSGSRTGLVLLLALGIPALAAIAAALLVVGRKRKAASREGRGSTAKAASRARKGRGGSGGKKRSA